MCNHHILLLKNPDSEPSVADPYTTALVSHGLSSSIIPTLSHTYHEPNRLADIVSRGAAIKYGGVIVTSGRAVDAWENVLRMVKNESQEWTNRPFYVVGPRTQSQLLSLAQRYPISKLLPSPDLVLGAQSGGTGESLARFILSDYPPRNTQSLPLLYLVGDKNAGGLEGVLRDHGIDIETLQVYATIPSETFERDFEKEIEQIERNRLVCVAFFAPSSADLALPTIRKHYKLATQLLVDTSAQSKASIRVVSIGPTTARALSERHHLVVHAVSKKPEPNALAEVIVGLLEDDPVW